MYLALKLQIIIVCIWIA